ncbi:hypothetical protein ACOSQ4_014950 [Xanthoceras sorbifolium]
MASATTRPTLFFHHLSQSSSPPPKPTSTTLLFSKKTPKQPLFISLSIDVSKEDKSTSDQQPNPPPSPSPPPPPPAPSPSPLLDLEYQEDQETFDKRRLEEKFAVLNTGIFECRSCGYAYDEAVGDPSYPIPPGFQFDKLPGDWRCPTCGAAQSFFESKSVEIAGFAQNQQFGLGGNALTSGQKAVLIYGSLLLFFVLFLSGYFLQ